MFIYSLLQTNYLTIQKVFKTNNNSNKFLYNIMESISKLNLEPKIKYVCY